MTRARRAMPSLDRRASPSSAPEHAHPRPGASRSCGGRLEDLRTPVARLHAGLDALQHARLHVVVEQLAGTALDQPATAQANGQMMGT